ncbi:hypothetical protein NDN08_004646 [Rhodosorus marinus]|uniref:HIG1 domain-containing protein n=1 Tax=Rhodosorus marinus TaxID=101924 RepID=A0AAV8UPX1_9RHOD|nr:hypothetical protein NDN08_004646 [Rhodosorus marinus]
MDTPDAPSLNPMEMTDDDVLALRTDFERKHVFYDAITGETRTRRRSVLNPWIIGGLGVTILAFLRGLNRMQARDSKGQQMMMRLRIAGQGFTVGAVYYLMKNPVEMSDRERAEADAEFISRKRVELETQARRAGQYPL